MAVLSGNFPGEFEEVNETLHSGQPISWLGYEAGTAQIYITFATHWTAKTGQISYWRYELRM
jgi:hypothetical protein